MKRIIRGLRRWKSGWVVAVLEGSHQIEPAGAEKGNREGILQSCLGVGSGLGVALLGMKNGSVQAHVSPILFPALFRTLFEDK